MFRAPRAWCRALQPGVCHRHAPSAICARRSIQQHSRLPGSSPPGDKPEVSGSAVSAATAFTFLLIGTVLFEYFDPFNLKDKAEENKAWNEFKKQRKEMEKVEKTLLAQLQGQIEAEPESIEKNCKFAPRAQMLKAASIIATVLGTDAVSYDEEDIEHHGRSDWSTSNTAERPVAVVYPRSTKDVVQIATICNKLNVPMVPYAGGSSTEGNFSSPYSGICIDFTHMDKVVAFHPEDLDVVVQPGVNWVDLNNQIKDSGLWLPVDPSPTAKIGGMVSTNCSGTNAMRYGPMKDWVVNLTVVMADGSVIKTRRRPRKTSAGYNLTSLFVGAEGTLGIVTEITLKLAAIPEDTSVAVVSFPNISDASKAAIHLIRSGIPLAALELMDDVQMKMVNVHGSAAVKRHQWAEEPTLFLKFSGTTKAIKGDIERVEKLVKPFSARKFHYAKTKQDELDLWAARKEVLFTMVSNRPEGTQHWGTDVAVPLSRLAEIIEISKKECSELGLWTSIVGHVGDGNFHASLFYDPNNPEQKAKVMKVVDAMMHRALEMDGTVSGEHAIGIGKKDCLIEELGLGTVNVMKTLKNAVDPKWLLNPGKVFDLPVEKKAKGWFRSSI